MADILTDYRTWRSQQEERIGTHSDDCHMWPRHERCMIHRLAAALSRTRAALVAVAVQDGTLSVSEGRLFVDVGDTEELAFGFDTPPTLHTPRGDSVQELRSVRESAP